MNYLEKLIRLNEILGSEDASLARQVENSTKKVQIQENLFRSLRNIRNPGPVSEEYLTLEKEVLEEQNRRKGIVDVAEMRPVKEGSPFYLYQGDITRLNANAIVNAANSEMLGCFIPLHNCIDNAIHSAAGVELRNACAELMAKQAHPEETGEAKITQGYNLPAKTVIHTVGPIVGNMVTDKNREDLKHCYESILEVADENNLNSVAFCCISTGVFRFPNDEAAKIAVDTVSRYLDTHPDTSLDRIIFNVFTATDLRIYENLLY